MTIFLPIIIKNIKLIFIIIFNMFKYIISGVFNFGNVNSVGDLILL